MPVINTNIAANIAVGYLNSNQNAETSALAKLSSGSRITSASDDAAGLAISTRINSDVVALQQAATNAAEATSILQIADGGASNVSDILARMKAITSEAASGTTTDSSRAFIDSEFQGLLGEIDSIASGTRYSGGALLDGTFGATQGAGQGGGGGQGGGTAQSQPVSVLVGSEGTDTISITLANLTTAALFQGVDPATLNLTTQANATAMLGTLDTAIDTVSNARAEIGAQESRFNFSSSSIQTQTQNLQSATSTIRDVDVAAEQAALSSAQVKVSAAVSAEVAANNSMQSLLKLFG
jgi:flagellin